ncbi:MAG: protein phosphatase 2C domain-containing protein [Ruminococcus sp.]|nr:protein phosphatase 2C domain-containing protein [Ruminococcus sp.]
MQFLIKGIDLENNNLNEVWQTLPIPEYPEPHPARQADLSANDRFKLTAASVRGRSHKHDGTNRDDYYSYRVHNRFTAVAVCDGAGSKPLSRIGAKIAAKAAIRESDAFSELLTEELLTALACEVDSDEFKTAISAVAAKVRDIFAVSYDAVCRGVKKRYEKDPESFSENIDDYSSTLLYAIIIPLFSDTLVISLTVGDGNIGALTDGGIRILGATRQGEYSGETDFLESENVLSEESLKSRTRIIRENVKAVVLLTDGVADDYFPFETGFARLWEDISPILSGNGSDRLADFLDTYFVRGSFDDRTLIAVEIIR